MVVQGRGLDYEQGETAKNRQTLTLAKYISYSRGNSWRSSDREGSGDGKEETKFVDEIFGPKKKRTC